MCLLHCQDILYHNDPHKADFIIAIVAQVSIVAQGLLFLSYIKIFSTYVHISNQRLWEMFVIVSFFYLENNWHAFFVNLTSLPLY